MSGDSIGATLSSAQALLARLGKRLDEPISWELKRHLVEVLMAGVRVETVECWGVKQSRITVTYRFSQPDQSMLVLSQSYSPNLGVRIPVELQTIGDHIRRRRQTLKLLQKQVAEQIGVDETSIYNWERNLGEPRLKYIPPIIAFLGYNPLPAADTLAEQLMRQRTSLGLTQKETAQQLGVDPSTLALWEGGEREPTGAFLARANRFLAERAEHPDLRRVG